MTTDLELSKEIYKQRASHITDEKNVIQKRIDALVMNNRSPLYIKDNKVIEYPAIEAAQIAAYFMAWEEIATKGQKSLVLPSLSFKNYTYRELPKNATINPIAPVPELPKWVKRGLTSIGIFLLYCLILAI